MRPKPGLWLRLPGDVDDAAKLAAYLREYAHACGDRPHEWPQQMLLAAASLLDGCAGWDESCVRGVVEALDARGRACQGDSATHERRYWESVAHAVDRVADSLADAGWQRISDSDH